METSPVLWVINATEARHPVVTPITFDIGDLLVVCVGGFATPEERRISALKFRHGVLAPLCAGM
jgi:hypothetical protein